MKTLTKYAVVPAYYELSNGIRMFYEDLERAELVRLNKIKTYPTIPFIVVKVNFETVTHETI